jgi:hypothetical protein
MLINKKLVVVVGVEPTTTADMSHNDSAES